MTLYVDKHTEEDIILLSRETETPKTALVRSTPTTTSTRTVKEPTPTPTKADTTVMQTNPTPMGGFAEDITTIYAVIGLVAALFALLQIRRS